ncbi:hypothetical protein HHI36_009083 [Cryptolaemus montrouzieri]|uniref:Uncharacterized protein n=1 Tax=Cryptolaemus montrouzieri TaxID=559131 RepID=A0ABD2MUV7_9CUCU
MSWNTHQFIAGSLTFGHCPDKNVTQVAKSYASVSGSCQKTRYTIKTRSKKPRIPPDDEHEWITVKGKRSTSSALRERPSPVRGTNDKEISLKTATK